VAPAADLLLGWGECNANLPWGAWDGGQEHGTGCLTFDTPNGLEVSPNTFGRYFKSSAMSASTQAGTTLPKPACGFPGNCTMEKALKTIVDVYHRYSIREGKPDSLNFNDFNTLLKEQAPNFLKACVSAYRTSVVLPRVMVSSGGWWVG